MNNADYIIKISNQDFTDLEKAIGAIKTMRPAIVCVTMAEASPTKATFLKTQLHNALCECSSDGTLTYDIFYHPNASNPKGFDFINIKY